MDSGQLVHRFEDNSGSINCIAFSPDGCVVAAGGDKTVWLWDVNTGQLAGAFGKHLEGLHTVLFSPDGRILLSGSQEKISLWTASIPDLPTAAQTAVAATSTAFPVHGSVLIAYGHCCKSGVEGQPVDIDVRFEATSPFGEVTEMRIAEDYSTEDEIAEASWEPFETQRVFQFTPPTFNWYSFEISVQYRDAKGNLSPVYYDDIGVEGMPVPITHTPTP